MYKYKHMNFEALKNISSKIETDNKSEREKLLFEKIGQISLAYAEKKFEEEKESEPGYKFSKAVKDFSAIRNIILRPLFSLDNFHFKDYEKEIKKYFDDFYQELDIIYEAGDASLDKISDLVSLKTKGIREYIGIENFAVTEAGNKGKDTKVINFNKIENIERGNGKKYEALKKYGFASLNHFLELHVDEFYGTEANNLGPAVIKDDLGKAAEYIVDKAPEIVAVIGHSWLLDTALSERLGFKKIEGEDIKENDFSTWLQFIDKNGQIDQKKFSHLMETGKIPYKSSKGFIPTEEFLKKYLPIDRRGKIVLREVDEEKKEFFTNMQSDMHFMKYMWKHSLDNNISFESFIRNNKSIGDVLSLLSSKEKDEYIKFLRAMHENKISWFEFAEHKDEALKVIDEKIEQLIMSDMYKDKELVID